MSSFNAVYDQMMLHGMKVPFHKVQINIEDSKKVLIETFDYFLSYENTKFSWLPEYEDVADWLRDNGGRGLFLYGNCGRGKSLLCNYVLPAILLEHCRRVMNVFDVQEMNRDINYVLTKRLIGIDDIGTEEVSVRYGERRLAFAEVMDAVEKQSKLVIVSTNLTQNEIKRRYGERTLDRIVATTKRVLFEGKSLRK